MKTPDTKPTAGWVDEALIVLAALFTLQGWLSGAFGWMDLLMIYLFELMYAAYLGGFELGLGYLNKYRPGPAARDFVIWLVGVAFMAGIARVSLVDGMRAPDSIAVYFLAVSIPFIVRSGQAVLNKRYRNPIDENMPQAKREVAARLVPLLWTFFMMFAYAMSTYVVFGMTAGAPSVPAWWLPLFAVLTIGLKAVFDVFVSRQMAKSG
ncbi:Uncharacterised protein [uncultured archaeon]|nr:Uncharacterised protein [uncultured archaeon]